MKKINNKAELEAALKENDVTVVKIGAPWCGPCKTLERTIAEIEESNADTAEFLEVDVDEADEEFVDELKVRNIPVMFYYKGEELVDRSVGIVTKDVLLNNIEHIKEN